MVIIYKQGIVWYYRYIKIYNKCWYWFVFIILLCEWERVKYLSNYCILTQLLFKFPDNIIFRPSYSFSTTKQKQVKWYWICLMYRHQRLEDRRGYSRRGSRDWGRVASHVRVRKRSQSCAASHAAGYQSLYLLIPHIVTRLITLFCIECFPMVVVRVIYKPRNNATGNGTSVYNVPSGEATGGDVHHPSEFDKVSAVW